MQVVTVLVVDLDVLGEKSWRNTWVTKSGHRQMGLFGHRVYQSGIGVVWRTSNSHLSGRSHHAPSLHHLLVLGLCLWLFL